MNTTQLIPVPTSFSELEMWLFETHTSVVSTASAYIEQMEGAAPSPAANADHLLPDPPRRNFGLHIVESVLLSAS